MKKLLIIVLALVASVSIVEAKGKKKHNTVPVNSADSKVESKELTPAEKECVRDVDDFIFAYRIIKGMHYRLEEQEEHVPAQVKCDLAEANAAYDVLKKYLTKTSLYTAEVIDVGSLFLPFTGLFMASPQWALTYCNEMYNQEMNDMVGSNLRPISNDPFLESNFVCHTSYQEALKQIRAILHKYQSGQHRCR